MRFVERPSTVPEALRGEAVERELERAREHFSRRTTAALQRRFDFAPLWSDNSVAGPLLDAFQSRCAFCESPVFEDVEGPGGIEHFRPKQDATNGAAPPRLGQPSRQHYWWLAYQWDNLHIVCARCNRASGSSFPVDGARLKPETLPGGGAEVALLVDPCAEDPRLHFEFSDDGDIAALSFQGDYTINTYDLGRPELAEARELAIKQAIAELELEVTHGVPPWDPEDLQLPDYDERPYSQAVRQGAARWLRDRGYDEQADLADPPIDRLELAPHDDDRPTNRLASPQLLRSIEITNFRGIEHLKLDFRSAAGLTPWTMLIGENGHGKSSVLHAIALTLMGTQARDELARKLNLARFVRRTESGPQPQFAAITIQFDDIRAARLLRIPLAGQPRVEDRDLKDDPIAFAAYGAGRIQPMVIEEQLPVSEGRIRAKNLFDSREPLTPPELWLLKIYDESPDDTFPYVARVLASLVNAEEGSVVVTEEREVTLRQGGAAITLEHLSDGYRSMLTLSVDFMRFFVERWGSLQAANGIVLVDELDAHLHPRWQMRVVETLRDAFPRLQFITTTHAPLCLRGLEEGEVAVMRRDDGGHIYALTGEEVRGVSTMDVSGLLTSEVFGLHSTVSLQLDDDLRSYQRLLARRREHGTDALDDDELAQLEKLRGELAAARQLGSSAREQLALQEVDAYFGGIDGEADPERRGELRADVHEQLKAIWRGDLGPAESL